MLLVPVLNTKYSEALKSQGQGGTIPRNFARIKSVGTFQLDCQTNKQGSVKGRYFPNCKPGYMYMSYQLTEHSDRALCNLV